MRTTLQGLQATDYGIDFASKLIEVPRPELILDSHSKTALLTTATWADFYRVGAVWHDLQGWRAWRHGKQVNEVSHFDAYQTTQGDVLAVCGPHSDDVVCHVQVLEIRMMDCTRLNQEEVHELGYDTQQEAIMAWDGFTDMTRGWFIRFMLLTDTSHIVQ
ncbi:MAG: hypothetical protein JW910_17790 [Anaerolineae bacterium]|nr:hypothetical protein [Anaerolineae bacterium]